MCTYSIASLFSGLAEEAAELSAAASKMARFIRKDIPCDVEECECYSNVIKEFTHVMIYANDLGLTPYNEELFKKLSIREQSKGKHEKEDVETDPSKKDVLEKLKSDYEKLESKRRTEEEHTPFDCTVRTSHMYQPSYTYQPCCSQYE